MHIFLDESGDLGFSPGGSDFFTIAFVALDSPVSFKRCVRDAKIRYSIPREAELKGATTRADIKEYLLSHLSGLDLQIFAITVDKNNVAQRLREDTNILYNYMAGLLLGDYIKAQPLNTQVFLNADCRVVSIASGFKFNEYIKYKVWYEYSRTDIALELNHSDSKDSLAIQGIDIICNTIYRKYCSRNMELWNLIKGKVMDDRRLFFPK